MGRPVPRPVPGAGLPVLLRSGQAAVTGGACPSSGRPGGIRRGCPSHVADTTWMWHPRRIGLDGRGTGRTGGAGVTPTAGPVTHWTMLRAFRAIQGETSWKRVQSVPRLHLQGAQATLPLPGARRCEREPAEQSSQRPFSLAIGDGT